jgi:hypothetical protein
VDLGSEGVGQGAAPKNAMDPREGNNFVAAAKPMDWILDLRTRGHGVVGLGLQ